jgi:hypothetical protein
MPSLFISYRRSDSPDTVKRIHERLKQRLPRWNSLERTSGDFLHTNVQSVLILVPGNFPTFVPVQQIEQKIATIFYF